MLLVRKMIEIYHISNREHIEAIIADGLKTLQLQADEGLIDLEKTIKAKCLYWPSSEKLLSLRSSTNYFRLDLPPNNIPWVSILVDETKIDVMNNWLEYTEEIYFSSRMSLSTFLLRSENKEENLHPITAIPLKYGQKIKLPAKDGRLIERVYSAEVIVQQPCITIFHRYNLI